jgi:hypothetical protein
MDVVKHAYGVRKKSQNSITLQTNQEQNRTRRDSR